MAGARSIYINDIVAGFWQFYPYSLRLTIYFKRKCIWIEVFFLHDHVMCCYRTKYPAYCFPLNKYAFAPVVFPEFFRGTAFFTFKSAVEIGHIAEAALVGNLRDGKRRVDQHSRY